MKEDSVLLVQEGHVAREQIENPAEAVALLIAGIPVCRGKSGHLCKPFRVVVCGAVLGPIQNIPGIVFMTNVRA